jgi:hypothetical protein
VLFAGSASASEHGASLTILRMAEIGLIEALTSQQVVAECERNLEEKFPAALPVFRLLVSRCLKVVADPSAEAIQQHDGLADPKDLPILVASVQTECRWLVTFNVRHFQPGHTSITTLRPGDFVRDVRYLLAQLGEGKET